MISEKTFNDKHMSSVNGRESKFDSAPDWLMWTMTFINRIGFPIAVAIYLGYMQLNAMPKIVEALNNMSGVMKTVQDTVKENTSELRRIRTSR